MERSIGVLSGVVRPDAAPPALRRRCAAGQPAWRRRPFSSGDVGQFDELMTAGTRANLADNPAAAEPAFRAALALQQKVLGKDNPNTATTLMSLAVQLSNQGRFAEADALFAEAAPLVQTFAGQHRARARLLHYRGAGRDEPGQADEAAGAADAGGGGLRRAGCRPTRCTRAGAHGRASQFRPLAQPATSLGARRARDCWPTRGRNRR